MPIQTVSLTDEAFKQGFVEGKFVIDCVEIKLTQNAQSNPVVYSTSGYLHVSPSDGIEGRFISLQLVDTVEQLMKSMEIRSGEIFPESQFFTLEADMY